jgi:hypothetical protein
MPATTLPAKTYPEALPYLRAPYTPSVIRFRIQSVPDNNGPCVVVLFVNSETVMDRFNIVCGAEWTPPEFTVLAHRVDGAGDKATHHVKARATFTVFGQVFTDTAEASGQSEVQAEFNANARAFKRAARWPGPGQSLYQPSAITMFRGNGENELRVWSNDPKKPHIDKRSETFLLDHYNKMLAEKIIPIYGQPFDHLQALGGGASTSATVERAADLVPAKSPLVASATPASSTVAPPPPVQQLAAATNSEAPPPAATPAAQPTRQRAASSSETTAILDQARTHGYSDTLSEALMRLARENDETPLTTPFAECVKAWISVLTNRRVEEAKILEAVTFALDNCATRQGAQVKFGQWVAAKAKTPAAEQPAPAPATVAEGEASPQPTAETAEPQDGDPQVELAAAMRELEEAIDRHDYTERAAARIAALAIGADPDRRIDLAKIQPGTLRCVGELLGAAATLEWSTGKLDEEISRAHNSTQQGTSASRFGAFAIHLINSAEARAEEDALAAAAVGSA